MLRKMLRTLFDMCEECYIDLEKLLELYMSYNPTLSESTLLVDVILEEKKRYLKAISNGLKLAKKEILKKGLDSIDSNYFKSTYGLSQKYIDELIVNKSLKLK